MGRGWGLGAAGAVRRPREGGGPAGTAGVPMMQALLARQTREDGTTDLSDVVAVAVRYFGGLTLGAGGLARAYTGAVAQTLDSALFDSRERLRVGEVPSSHAEAGRLENEMRAAGLNVLGTEYGAEGAVISVGVFDRAEELSRAEELVVSLSSGAASVTWGETRWVDLPA